MKTYPMFALLSDKPCLVVGGGAVGERKVLDLLEAGARVTVVSRTLTPALAKLAAQGEIIYLAGDFATEQVESMALVMGATNDEQVNARVSAAARSRGIWVNIADAPELCTFIVPAQVRRGELTLAISTGGASPALARKLREELQGRFGPEYGPYLTLLKKVREQLLSARRGHGENPQLFHRLVSGPLKEALAQRDRDRAVGLLKETLGHALAPDTLAALVDEVLGG